MRATALLVFVLIAACGRSKGDALKLGDRPHAVGDTRTEHEDNGYQLMVQTPQGPVELLGRDLSDKTTEILEVDGAGNIAKVKVTYTSATTSHTALGENETTSPPTTGHSYLVWREGAGFRASRPDGSVPPDEELVLVLADHEFLVSDPIAKALDERTWRRGERVELSGDQLGGKRRSGVRFTSLVMTLRRVDGGVAHFEMHLGMERRGGGASYSGKLSGVIKVDVASGDLIEMAGGGPAQGNMDGLQFTGHATMLSEYR